MEGRWHHHITTSPLHTYKTVSLVLCWKWRADIRYKCSGQRTVGNQANTKGLIRGQEISVWRAQITVHLRPQSFSQCSGHTRWGYCSAGHLKGRSTVGKGGQAIFFVIFLVTNFWISPNLLDKPKTEISVFLPLWVDWVFWASFDFEKIPKYVLAALSHIFCLMWRIIFQITFQVILAHIFIVLFTGA